MFSTIAIIYNPNSTGPGELLAKRLAEELEEKLTGQKIELVQTEHVAHAEELAYKLATASDNPLIVSSSGDGGYNEVVNGAMRAKNEGRTVVIGLLPAGNANDHHRSLHKSNLANLIAEGKVRDIDLLKIEGTSKGRPIARYAHSYIGIGLTPKVGKELNKTKLNPFKEVWLVARVLFSSKPVRLKIAHKTEQYESIVFSNIDEMSKYLKISQPSSVTDGKFEITTFRHRTKLHLIGLLFKAVFTGAREDNRASRFAFQTVDETLVQGDGEVLTLDANTEAVVTIEKQTLRCIV